MAQITSKEMGAIGDALAMEETLIAKYDHYAQVATDPAAKTLFTNLRDNHRHYHEELYSHLK